MNKVNDNNDMTKPLGSNKNTQDAAVRAYRVIKADDSGELPTKIMLIKAGEWPDSVKGNLSISISDLQTMKRNFDAGIARPGQGLGLPIDFCHNEWDMAAGWIDGLIVEDDALYADPVDWSAQGKESILGKMFKCISPSFYPTGRGGYTDPENLDTSIENVIVGAGLTNIPFFKGLSPVKASSFENSSDDDSIIYIKQSVNAKEKDMPLDEVRIKAAADLTADEKKLLADNKAELSLDERKKFGLEESQVTANVISAEDAQILADIKAGKSKVIASTESVVDAARMASLEATAQAYEKDKAERVIADHVKRGAVKADQADRWTNRLLKASVEERAELETDLAALPTNKAIGTELGSSEEAPVNADSRVEIANLAAAKVAAATADGKTLDISVAMSQVLVENPDLAQRDREASKIN